MGRSSPKLDEELYPNLLTILQTVSSPGKHRDAIEAFKKSLEFQPNQADAHTNIASAYLMLKNVKEAVQHLEQASNFNPLDGEIQYNLGCVYEATGNLDGAKTRFERAEMLGIPKAKEALEKLAKKL